MTLRHRTTRYVYVNRRYIGCMCPTMAISLSITNDIQDKLP